MLGLVTDKDPDCMPGELVHDGIIRREVRFRLGKRVRVAKEGCSIPTAGGIGSVAVITSGFCYPHVVHISLTGL